MGIHHHTADLVAASRHGVITIAEARACGLTDEEIWGNVASKRWTRVVRGVFRVTGAPQTWEQRALVAVKAGPPATRLSHATAAALLDVGTPPRLPDVTVPPTYSARSRIARVHRSLLAPEDCGFWRGFPIVSPARLAVEMAEVFGGGSALDELLDTLLVRKHMLPADVLAAVERASARPGRKGLPALSAALAPWFVGGAAPDSVPEMTIFRRLLAWGFPVGERQLKVFASDGRFLGRIDIGWRAYRAGLEYDGAVAHAPRRWVSDAARQEAIEALGYRFVRADRRDLRPNATRVRDELQRILPRVA